MTQLLNVFAGLFLVYLLFAIVVSAVQEWWSQYFGHRGRFLQRGLVRLLADESIYVRVIQHPLIGGLYKDRAARGKPPAYVEPLQFAMAFANVVIRRIPNPVSSVPSKVPEVPPRLTFDNLRHAVCQLAGQRSPIAFAALPIIDKANGDLQLALHGLADWYSAAMDRVSGWYKAHAQRRLFVIGLLLAAMANIDTIRVFSALNRPSALSSQMVDMAREVVEKGNSEGIAGTAGLAPEQARKILETASKTTLVELPIGYDCLNTAARAAELRVNTVWTRCKDEFQNSADRSSISDWLMRLLGWALTALAGVIGAPYWFSALSRIVNIRGSGTKPMRAGSASA
jgi:hypothetical protein